MSRIYQYLIRQVTYFCLQSASSFSKLQLYSFAPVTVSSMKLLNPVVVGWTADGLPVGREEIGNLIVVAWTDTASSGRLMIFDGGGGDPGRDDEPPATEIRSLI